MIDTKALREKILDLAIRGKLVPQDPNDEPASVLLERIRKQKQHMVKEGKLKAKDVKNDTIIFKGDDNLHYEQFQDGSVRCIEDEIPFEIPKTWQWSRINSLSFYIIAGGDKPSVYSKNKTEKNIFPIYSNAIENDGLYGYTDKARVIIPSITVSGRGTIGFCCVRREPFVPIVRLLTITPSPLISLDFINYVFQKLLETGTGSSIPQLTVPMISTKLIPVAPENEQHRIVSIVSEALSKIDDIKKTGNELNDSISKLKSHILNLAIRGKLIPQDQNDEPASVLLERIRAEKKELIKQGKIKKDKKESVIFKGDDNSYYEKIENEVVDINDEVPCAIPNNWTFVRLENVLIYEQPTPYIVESTDYNNSYPTPVLTAGKSFIIGYTNETSGIKTNLPVIIFDDFTTESKYVDFPFKVKSSAMKILTTEQKIIDIKYAYYAMQTVECDNYNHKRYWISEFSQKLIPLPPYNEQIRIVKAIETINNILDTAFN